MNLPEFSVRNSIFANMLTVVVIIVGLLAAFAARRELFPAVDMDIVVITTVYPGAMPEEVENHVTIPIEDEIKGVNGIDKYISRSEAGISAISIHLDPDAANKERIINDISRKVDRARIHANVGEKPDVMVIEHREMAMHVCVGGSASEADVRKYADVLEAKLSSMENVSSIIKTGWRDPEIWVEVNADRIRDIELPLTQVATSLRMQNVNLPGGTIPQGSKELAVRTTGEIRTIDDIKNVVVRSNADGNKVVVGDIAVVKPALAENQTILRVNGNRGVMLSVEKTKNGDTIRIADAIKEMVAIERKSLPEGIEVSLLDFESFVIKRRLQVLLSNGLFGLILVLFFLPLLMNARIAVVTALGIPFAFLVALIVMGYFDISINMMTMFAMILVLGMLVDDAIIISENTFRHLESGKTTTEAAIAGASEVMWPVTATVLTTIAAFLPLAFLPGIMGRILKWVPIVVMITLAASLLEALVILPCHIKHFAKPLKKNGSERQGRGSRVSAALQNRYSSLLRRVLKHRVLFILVTVICFTGALALAVLVMEVDLFPADLIEIFFARITMERGTARDTTEAATAEVERRVLTELKTNEFTTVLTELGHIRDQHMTKFIRGSRYSMLTIYLSPESERTRDASEIIEILRASCEGIQGVESISFDKVQPGPPVGKPVEVKVVGSDLEVLHEMAAEVKEFLAGIKGVEDIEDDYESGTDELRLEPNIPEAARLGVDAHAIASTVGMAFYGMEATSIRGAAEDTAIKVMLPDDQRTVAQLKRLKIQNHFGKLVDLAAVSTIARAEGVSGISRHDGTRAITVSANIAEDGATMSEYEKLPLIRRITRRVVDRFQLVVKRLRSKEKPTTSNSVNKSIADNFSDISERYPGYRLLRSGEWESTAETNASMLRAFVIAQILIYAILVVQFKSATQPLVILVSVPFGIIGVILALLAHGKPVSFMAMMGMVGLTGVVVNDAIVLVSFVNELRSRGVPVHEAVTEGARLRLRPILLTTFTTVLGLAPVIYGIGGYEPFVAPAAIVLAYGLVFASFLTLLVVPCIYSLGADVQSALARRFSKAEARRPEE